MVFIARFPIFLIFFLPPHLIAPYVCNQIFYMLRANIKGTWRVLVYWLDWWKINLFLSDFSLIYYTTYMILQDMPPIFLALRLSRKLSTRLTHYVLGLQLFLPILALTFILFLQYPYPWWNKSSEKHKALSKLTSISPTNMYNIHTFIQMERQTDRQSNLHLLNLYIYLKFGPTVLKEDGSINRPALGAIVFSDR